MQIKKPKNLCTETRGLFRCEMQLGHISERHTAQIGDGRMVAWFKCRECGRNHSCQDHWRLEQMVNQGMAKWNKKVAP